MADEFRINTAYAERYNKWREKEELQKLKDKYGNKTEADLTSSSSESEEDEPAALTPQLEKDWLRTLAAIKNKDPRIYDNKSTFYHTQDEGDQKEPIKKEKKKKDKPVTLKDLERESILKKEKKFDAGAEVESTSEEDDDDEDEDEDAPKPAGYYEEQQKIRESFKSVLVDSESESDEEKKLFTKRQKTKEEEQKEEDEYLEWLKGQKDELKDDKQVGKELGPLRAYINKPDLDEGEKFVWNFILNKQYLEEDEDKIPTYEELTKDDFSEEEETLEKQDAFERGVNFRFEEPDSEFIKSYPRFQPDLMRRKDDSRAKRRQDTKERKQSEKEKKKEELKRLKNLKKREIMEKIEKIKEITGNKDVGFTEEDLEGDFDPEKYDQLMKKVFDEEYYGDEEEMEKPVFSDDEKLGLEEENWDKWKPGTSSQGVEEGATGGEYSGELHCEDPDFVMDADYDPNQPQEDRSFGLDGKKKKRKKKSRLAQVLEKKKPVFEPGDKTFEEYFDEYYKLDYEDLIGDIPCRFKYRNVLANDFGLSAKEILAARDRELNQWVSLKKMTQYRTEKDEEWDKKRYQQKAKNVAKKFNMIPSLKEAEQEIDDEEEEEESTKVSTEASGKKKRKKKKKKKKGGVSDNANNVSREETPKVTSQEEPQKRKKKKKRVATDQQQTFSPPIAGAKSKDTETPKGKKLKKKEVGTDTVGEKRTPAETLSTGDKLTKKKKRLLSAGDSSDSAPVTKKQKLEVKKAAGQKEEGAKKKKKKIKKDKMSMLSAERLKAYGIDPKKFRYTHGKHSKERKMKEGNKS